MPVPVPTNMPGLDAVEQPAALAWPYTTHIARPTAGRQLAGLAEHANWCEGWLFRHQATAQTDHDSFYYGGPAAARTHSLLWFPRVGADYVWIAFTYRTKEPVTGPGAPSVVFSLYNPSGAVVVDAGATWSLAQGDLTPEGDEELGGARKRRAGNLAHSGWATDPQINPAVLSTAPRMLRLSTFGGLDVELQGVATLVDLYTISIWEAWTPELP